MASSWSRYGTYVLCRGVSFPHFELWSSVRHNVSCPFERQYVKWMSCLNKIFSSISHLVFVMPSIAIMVLELLSFIEFVWDNVSCTFERLAALEKFVVGWILLMRWEDLVGRGMKWMVRCDFTKNLSGRSLRVAGDDNFVRDGDEACNVSRQRGPGGLFGPEAGRVFCQVLQWRSGLSLHRCA